MSDFDSIVVSVEAVTIAQTQCEIQKSIKLLCLVLYAFKFMTRPGFSVTFPQAAACHPSIDTPPWRFTGDNFFKDDSCFYYLIMILVLWPCQNMYCHNPAENMCPTATFSGA